MLRSLRALGLAVLAVLAHAADVATLAGADLDQRWTAYRAAALAVQRAAAPEAWKASGPHGAGEAQMLEALELYARIGAGQAPAGSEERLLALIAAAERAGCADPLTTYLELRGQGDRAPASALIGLWVPLTESKPPPLFPFCLARRAINATLREGGAKDPRLPPLWQNLPALAAPLLARGTGTAEAGMLLASADILWDLPGQAGMAALECQRAAIEAACAQANAAPWWRMHLLGLWHIEAAWCARGGGWSNTVTKEGWAGFSTHLKMARACLTRAWQLDPGNGRSATGMITVCMGDGSYDEARIWFERAVSADPFADRPYEALGQLLMPRWGGSIGALLDLAGECVACRAWTTPIPRQAVGLLRLARQDAERASPRSLWDDARAWRCLDVLTGEGRTPGGDAATNDGERLVYAWRCGKRDEALRLRKLPVSEASVGWALGWTGGEREAMDADLRAWAGEGAKTPDF